MGTKSTSNVQLLFPLGACAKRLCISERHFLNLVMRGVLPNPIKLGRCSRWRLSDIEAALFRAERKNRRNRGRPRSRDLADQIFRYREKL